MKVWISLAILVWGSIRLPAQSFNADFVRYVNEDGVTYKDYLKVDSRRMTSWHYIEKGKNPEDVFSFISPPEYTLIPNLDEKYNQISFNRGSFSLIREDSMRQDLTIRDGLYIFQNGFDESKDGYYGCFAIPDGFKFLNYVWVFPSNIEVVDYESNREGQWRLIDNTLSFIAADVNNVLFKIRYKRNDPQPLTLADRKVSLRDSITVKNKYLDIYIWDDGKIDNDVISVKLNDDWIIQYLEAGKDKIKFRYLLTEPVNYLILRADNVGQIPPNTTAIHITDGKLGKTVVLNSDLGYSEAIKITLQEDPK